MARWVMREVRLRIAGPVAVYDLAEYISERRGNLTEESRRLILQSVGEANHTRRGCPSQLRPFAHPVAPGSGNLAGVDPNRVEFEPCGLKNLSPQAQDLLLTVLTAATILNSRLRKAQ